MKNNKVNELKVNLKKLLDDKEKELTHTKNKLRESNEELWSIEVGLTNLSDLMVGDKRLWVVEYYNAVDGAKERRIIEITIHDIQNYVNKNTAFYIAPRVLSLNELEDWQWMKYDDDIYWLGDFDGNGNGCGNLLYFLAGKKIQFWALHKDEIVERFKKENGESKVG